VSFYSPLIPLSRNFIKLRFLLLIHNPVKEIGIGLGIHPIWDCFDFGFWILDFGLSCNCELQMEDSNKLEFGMDPICDRKYQNRKRKMSSSLGKAS